MENEIEGKSNSDNATPDIVNIERSGAQTVNANHVTLRQGGVQSVNSDQLIIRQGGVVNARTARLEMIQAGAGMVQTDNAQLTTSTTTALIARGGVQMDQSTARVLVAGGEVSMDQGGSVLTVANNVRMKNSGTIFLFARQVEGNVKPVFGPRESMIFGAIAGLVAGTIMLLGNIFRRRRRG